MVRRPIRPLPPARDVETAAQGLHCGGFQRFVLRHRRQDPRKAGRQHRLAGTIVSMTSISHLSIECRFRLTPYVSEIKKSFMFKKFSNSEYDLL